MEVCRLHEKKAKPMEVCQLHENDNQKPLNFANFMKKSKNLLNFF